MVLLYNFEILMILMCSIIHASANVYIWNGSSSADSDGRVRSGRKQMYASIDSVLVLSLTTIVTSTTAKRGTW
jgi:hypothetical protein